MRKTVCLNTFLFTYTITNLIPCFCRKYVSRVELLKQKREEKKNVVSTKSNQKEKKDENDSEDSDDALDDILNWRAKKA